MNAGVVWLNVLHRLAVFSTFFHGTYKLAVGRLYYTSDYAFLAFISGLFLELDFHNIAIKRKAEVFTLDNNIFF